MENKVPTSQQIAKTKELLKQYAPPTDPPIPGYSGPLDHNAFLPEAEGDNMEATINEEFEQIDNKDTSDELLH